MKSLQYAIVAPALLAAAVNSFSEQALYSQIGQTSSGSFLASPFGPPKATADKGVCDERSSIGTTNSPRWREIG